jgi:hypothetical protein
VLCSVRTRVAGVGIASRSLVWSNRRHAVPTIETATAMNEPGPLPLPRHDPGWLRDDLQKEYYEILGVVSGFDQRLLTIKGWSVTLSLALLGLGFQQGHYALFGLAAITGVGFWTVEAISKSHQMRFYSRMRDIELAAYNLNHVMLPVIDESRRDREEPLGEVSAPRIDMYWSYPKGQEADWRASVPWRRTPEDLRKMLHRAAWRVHIMMPHVIAVVVGVAFYLLAVGNTPGFDHLSP